MDLSLLLLITPMIPAPPPPVVGVPAPAVEAGPRPAVGPGEDSRPPGEDSRPPVSDCRCPRWPAGAEIPGVPCCPAGIGWKSVFVIGSLNFLRRNRSRTRTSMFGGNAFAYLREKSVIACT